MFGNNKTIKYVARYIFLSILVWKFYIPGIFYKSKTTHMMLFLLVVFLFFQEDCIRDRVPNARELVQCSLNRAGLFSGVHRCVCVCADCRGLLAARETRREAGPRPVLG